MVELKLESTDHMPSVAGDRGADGGRVQYLYILLGAS